MMKWICGMNEKRNKGRERGERERERLQTPLLAHTIPVVGYRYVLTSLGIEKPKNREK